MIEIQEYTYKTMEEAKEYRYNLRTKMELKQLAEELNNGEPLDWTNDNQIKYSIAYDHNAKQLRQTFETSYQFSGSIYCLDEDFLDKALEKINEDLLVDMIKSGV
jgi:hypothetical protein